MILSPKRTADQGDGAKLYAKCKQLHLRMFRNASRHKKEAKTCK